MPDSDTPWAVAHQAPLSVEFSRQAYWSGWPSPPPGVFPNQAWSPRHCVSCIGRQTLYPCGPRAGLQCPHRQKAEARSVVSSSLWPHNLQPSRLLCPQNFPGQNTGVGCHSCLQGNLPDPGTEPGYPALQVDSLPSEPPRKPSNVQSSIIYSHRVGHD